MFYLFAVLFGLGFGGEVALISPMVADLFGLKAHGAILGIVTFAWTVGGSVGTLIAGYLFDITGNYYFAFMLCVVIIFAGIILAVKLKPTREKAFV